MHAADDPARAIGHEDNARAVAARRQPGTAIAPSRQSADRDRPVDARPVARLEPCDGCIEQRIGAVADPLDARDTRGAGM
jgi:hypothetical protein